MVPLRNFIGFSHESTARDVVNRMLILGIETSCDETSVALVEDGRRLVASDVASQVLMHAKFGGVVPELASRAHIQKLVPMVDECLERNGLALKDVDALAVTLGPGLVGALLVGVETAKALAFSAKKPLIPVHHIAGHLYSPLVSGPDEAYRHIVVELDALPATEVTGPDVSANDETVAPAQNPQLARREHSPLDFPYLGLVVSGGHSSLVLVQSAMEFEILGETVDDAAGEAFDKLAKLLHLGYPGGPRVEKTARGGNRSAFAFPRPMSTAQHGYKFSFSGLKTAALKQVADLGGSAAVNEDPQLLSDICASFQEAIVDVLLSKAKTALKETGCDKLAIVGGVACNGRLREAAAERLGGRALVVFPPPALCTDNAAMIAGLAWHHRDLHRACNLKLNAQANLKLGPVPA